MSDEKKKPALKSKFKHIVLLGPPCSGKGTAADWIEKQTGIPHFSTGVAFREEIASGSEVGKLANAFIVQGKLVPDDVVLKVVDSWMSKNDDHGFVLDGFPRTLPQGELFQDLLKKHKVPLDVVFYLNASRSKTEERVVGRLVCKVCRANYHNQNHPPKVRGICDICGGALFRREDDSLETLRTRWAEFESQTLGLVDFYRKQGVLKEFEADGNAQHLYEILGKLLAD